VQRGGEEEQRKKRAEPKGDVVHVVEQRFSKCAKVEAEQKGLGHEDEEEIAAVAVLPLDDGGFFLKEPGFGRET